MWLKSVGMMAGMYITSLASAQSAPDFTVTDIYGTEHVLYHDYLEEGRAVVLGFFYVGAPLVDELFPELEAYAMDEWYLGTPVDFLMMSNVNTASELLEVAYDLSFDLPMVAESGGADTAMTPYMEGEFGTFFGYPMFVVVAPDGTVYYDPWGSDLDSTIDAIDSAVDMALGVVSVNDLSASPEVTVWAAYGQLEVRSNTTLNARLRVFDLQGRSVIDEELNSSSESIPLPAKAAVIYTLEGDGLHVRGKVLQAH